MSGDHWFCDGKIKYIIVYVSLKNICGTWLSASYLDV